MTVTAQAPRHSALDDAQALLTGVLFVAMGLALFRHAGLVTGLLGLIVVVPWLAHASWHAYRELVE